MVCEFQKKAACPQQTILPVNLMITTVLKKKR